MRTWMRSFAAATLAVTLATLALPAHAPAQTVVPVYRFLNKRTGTHFYTASETEKNRVISTLSGTFAFEGPGYTAYPGWATNSTPVYRFYNNRTGTHFYTASETEKNRVISTLSSTFSFEGPAYWVTT